MKLSQEEHRRIAEAIAAAERGTSVRAVETMLARLYTALGVDADEQANPRVTAARMWQQGRVRIR